MSDFDYKVSIKNGAAWRNFDTARFQISVGGDRHEGAKFEATCRWAQARFRRVIVCVNDTLQRHNIEFLHGLSDKDAEQKSRAAGSDWIQRNQEHLRLLPNREVIRWDRWLNAEGFEHRHQEAQTAFICRSDFATACHAGVETLLDRRRNRGDAVSDAAAGKTLEYILEEVAAYSLMYDQENALDVYPGTRLEALAMVQDQRLPLSDRRPAQEQGFARIDFGRQDRMLEHKKA